jgi:hypothetical protein
VSELLAIVRGLVADERARGQSLDAKTSTLTGFTGATLALVATLAKDVVLKPGLGTVGEPLARVLFVWSVCALTVAAMVGLAGVLRPQARLDIATDELEGFAQFPLIATPVMEIQGRLLNTLIDALIDERRRNDRKAVLTRRTSAALGLGYLGVAAVAVTIAIGT